MASIGGQEKFRNALSEAQDKGRAVAIYSDLDDFQSYGVGFVEHTDSNEVVLQCLTPRGEPDGRTAIRMEHIVRVDVDTVYTKKLELLYEYRSTIFDKDFLPSPKGATSLRAQLQHALERHVLVHLVDSNDFGPSGFVRAVGEDFVEVERIGANGEPDGIAAILIAAVTKVHFGRRQEQMLEFLYRYNFELKHLIGS
jgi:hypothetical protein